MHQLSCMGQALVHLLSCMGQALVHLLSCMGLALVHLLICMGQALVNIDGIDTLYSLLRTLTRVNGIKVGFNFFPLQEEI